jgi:ATP-dependent RNA helicase SUPV3L1/SUV3
MTESDSTMASDAPESAPESATSPAPPPSFDFSHVRGFQSVDAVQPQDAEAYALALQKELVMRAERFAKSVDEAIVLASDGVVRWLGDPVGRLVAGDELLKPRVVALVDEAMPADAREVVETRLLLWVGAHVRKVLGALEALVAVDGLADSAREVAAKLAEALGVLDRERVRAQVKGLDQNARAALRKLGVRFGAHYIFLPMLLKPGPRTLCSQLHALKHSAEPGAERLNAFAASGRTSFAAEGTLSPDSYRVAGFRLCGERVVRVDIVERLTDLIRAAIPEQMRPGWTPSSDAAGFVVTQQMTSLTGCAGEAFASILRSLGYESHTVKKADFEAAMRKPEPPTPAAPPAAESGSAAEPPNEASAEAQEAAPQAEATVEAPDTASTEAEAEDAETRGGQDAEVLPAEPVAAEAEALPAEPVAAEAEALPAEPEAAAAEALPAETEAAEAEALPAETEAAEAEALPTETEAAAAEALPAEPEVAETKALPAETEAAEAEGEATDAAAAASEAPAPDEEPPSDVAEPEAAAEESEPEASEEPAPTPAEPPAEEWIEIWRPAPRPRRQHHHHHHRRHGPAEGLGRIVWRAKEPAPGQERRGGARPQPPPEDATPTTPTAAEPDEAPTPAPAEAPRESRRDEPHRNRQGDRRPPPPEGGGRRDRDERRHDRGPKGYGDGAPRNEPRSKPIDPDSPFAKLAALKPLLERQDKKK